MTGLYRPDYKQYSYTTFCIMDIWTVLQPIITVEQIYSHTTFYTMNIWTLKQPIITVEQTYSHVTFYNIY